MRIFHLNIFFLAGLIFISAGASFCTAKMTEAPMTETADSTQSSFFQFTVNGLDGNPVDLSTFRGKKIVVLNTASECGYTPQYADWEKFYEDHKDKVVVLGFPSNDFGGQEPGSSHEISTFCQQNYGVTFPMFEKVDVKGANKAPVYQWLTDAQLNGWNNQEPTWNFCKYVLDENGQLVKFFASATKPDNPEFLKAMGM